MSQIDSQSRFADHMAGECFDRVWDLLAKEAWWNESDRNKDIDAAVDDNMAEINKPKENKATEKPKKDNPTGNSTMDRMIARAKGNEPPKKPATRKPANLQSETLRRLHAKVKKD